MKVKIVCVGRVKEKYFTEAIEEYKKRLTRFCTPEIVEVNECLERNPNPSEARVATILETEASEILKKAEGFVVVCDREGEMLSSEELSQRIHKEKQRYSTFTFILGSSYGLAKSVKQGANLLFSFGSITLPHTLARVVLTEQIYRAFMIESNGSYHK